MQIADLLNPNFLPRSIFVLLALYNIFWSINPCRPVSLSFLRCLSFPLYLSLFLCLSLRRCSFSPSWIRTTIFFPGVYPFFSSLRLNSSLNVALPTADPSPGPGSYMLPGGVSTRAKGTPFRNSPAAMLSGRNKFGSPFWDCYTKHFELNCFNCLSRHSTDTDCFSFAHIERGILETYVRFLSARWNGITHCHSITWFWGFE